MAMLQAVDVCNGIVTAIRSIPNIEDHFEGDKSRIFSYETTYPGVGLDRAIAEMPQPGLMVAWIFHQYQQLRLHTPWMWGINLYFRISEQPKGDPLKGYGGLWVAVMDGIPSAAAVPFRDHQFNSRILQSVQLGIRRETLLASPEYTLDYYVCEMRMPQTIEE